MTANKDATLIFLEGSEGWLALKRDELRKAAEDWVLIRHDDREPGQIYQELRSYSFFGGKRTIFLERVDQYKKDDLVELNEAMAAVAPNSEVYLSALAGKADAVKKTVEEAGGKAKSEPRQSSGAVTKSFAKEGLNLAPELQSLLEETFADAPIRLRSELEKLALLADPGSQVGLDDWRGLSSEPGVVDGWRFARAVMARDLTTAESVLRTWTQEGGGGHSAGRDLLGAVSYVLRQYMLYKLHRAKGESPSQAARTTPGRFGPDDQKHAEKWSPAQLGKALDKLVDLDRNLKSIGLPADEQLYHWCVAVVQ